MNNNEIVDLLDNLKKKSEKVLRKYQTQGRLNESFVASSDNQFSVIKNAAAQDIRVDWWDDVPKKATNLLTNIVLTWTTLLTQERPTAVAYPTNTDDPGDVFDSQVANKLIQYLETELDVSNVVHRTAYMAAQHGTSGIKIYFNQNTGNVEWRDVTIFDYFIEPVSDWQKARWVIFHEYISEDDARALYKLNPALEHDTPSVVDYENNVGDELSGVLKQELWMLPSEEFPRGLYACVVDNRVVEHMDYPFMFQEEEKLVAKLPIVLFKVRYLRDSPYGGTFLTDCISLQRGLNEINSRLFKLMRQTSNAHRLLPRALAESIQDESGIIWYDDPEQIAQVDYLAPPAINPILFDQRDYFKASIYDVAGVNEVTTGSAQKSGTSGKAIEHMANLDALKNADAFKSLQRMILTAWQLTLQLVQMYYKEERKMRITNEDQTSIVLFKGSDIQGVDLRLEYGSEKDKSAGALAAQAKEDVMAGILDKSGYDAAVGAPGTALAKKLAKELIDQYLTGQDTSVAPEDIEPAVFVAALDKAIAEALRTGNKEDFTALNNLKAQYLQSLEEAPEPVGQAQPSSEGNKGTLEPLSEASAPPQ